MPVSEKIFENASEQLFEEVAKVHKETGKGILFYSA